MTESTVSINVNGQWLTCPATRATETPTGRPLRTGESAKLPGGRWVHGPALAGPRDRGFDLAEQKCDRCGDRTGPFLATNDASGRRVTICARTCKTPAGSEHSDADTTASEEITGRPAPRRLSFSDLMADLDNEQDGEQP